MITATCRPATRATLSPAPPHPCQPRLLDMLRNEIRLRHYSIRTEQTYIPTVESALPALAGTRAA